MTTHRNKKVRKQRGSKNHGKGIGAKHAKGAGSRGGRGMAGSGKRADQKKPSIWKDVYFGKFGFVSKSRTAKIYPINIKTIEDTLETLVRSGKAKQEKDSFTIDLSELGYNKLLSTGNPTKKLIITVAYTTKTAAEKIKAAGGEVKGKVVEEKAEKAK